MWFLPRIHLPHIIVICHTIPAISILLCAISKISNLALEKGAQEVVELPLRESTLSKVVEFLDIHKDCLLQQ